EKGLIMESQPNMTDPARKRLIEMYSGWFGLEGRTMCEQINKKAKRMTWYSGPADASDGGPAYQATVIFTFPQIPQGRVAFGGATLDSNYLQSTYLPATLDEIISKKLSSKDDTGVADMLHELSPQDPEESSGHQDERLTMMVYLADAGSGEGY